jgi:hypothetical protein
MVAALGRWYYRDVVPMGKLVHVGVFGALVNVVVEQHHVAFAVATHDLDCDERRGVTA